MSDENDNLLIDNNEEIHYENEESNETVIETEIEAEQVNDEKKAHGATVIDIMNKAKAILISVKDCILRFLHDNGVELIWAAVYFGFLIFFSWVWFKLLGDTFSTVREAKTYETVYYYFYLIYTIVSCLIPLAITVLFIIFKQNVDRNCKALTNPDVSFSRFANSEWEAYKETFFDSNFGIVNKTRASADLYFNYESVIGSLESGVPLLSVFKLISGSFMGLGILGTFIGFSQGLSSLNFQTENVSIMTAGIEQFVQGGLSTAFNTSIVGVILSLIYNFVIFSPLIKRLSRYFSKLSDKLDSSFYVSETEALMKYAMVTGENAETITFSQSLRFIVENMNKQTEALNNFNTNLADKIGNMQNSVNTALDRISMDVGDELKDAVMENFDKQIVDMKKSLADGALGMAAAAEQLCNTPKAIEEANKKLQTYLEETRSSFGEMLNENLDHNKQMLDQVVTTVEENLTNQFKDFEESFKSIFDSTKKASNVFDKLPEKIENVQKTFEEQESEVAKRFNEAADKLVNVSNGTKEFIETVQDGIEDILDELTSAEDNVKDLLASATISENKSGENLTSVIEQTNKMLAGFHDLDISLSNIFKSIGDEIARYNTTVGETLDKYLDSFEKGTSAFATTVHSSMEEFEDSLDSYGESMIEVQKTSAEFSETVKKLHTFLDTSVKDKNDGNK